MSGVDPTIKQINEALEKFRIPDRDGYFFPHDVLYDDTTQLIGEALKAKMLAENLEARTQTYPDGIIVSFAKAG